MRIPDLERVRQGAEQLASAVFYGERALAVFAFLAGLHLAPEEVAEAQAELQRLDAARAN
jgi:predicted cobalt transporter CbtA